MKARDLQKQKSGSTRKPGKQMRYKTYPLSAFFSLNLQNRHVAIAVDLVAIEPCLVVVVAPKHRGAG
jgi:hypothetical protein